MVSTHHRIISLSESSSQSKSQHPHAGRGGNHKQIPTSNDGQYVDFPHQLVMSTVVDVPQRRHCP